MNEPLSSRTWFPKVSAATLAGGLMTIGLMGVIGLLLHSTGNPRSLTSQYLMWLAALLWVAFLGTCFLVRSGRQAWLYLAAGNVPVWTLYTLARVFFS
jgi:hypothetical protein